MSQSLKEWSMGDINSQSEEWLQHPEFPTYSFSSNGSVKSTHTAKQRLLIGTKCGEGYRAIDFRVNGETARREYIHRVVCTLFNGKPPEGAQCRHLDGDMTNNSASNLAWGTALDNSNDKFLHGTVAFGELNPMAVLTAEKVEEMRKVREASNKPFRRIAKDFGVSTMTAFRAITKRAWK